MRDFSSVSPQFWIGSTGKALRGDSNAQVLALYLLTCPHANMIGVFHCPVMYMAHETGMQIDVVRSSLSKLVGVGFCIYDEELECVFVVNMAAFQVGDNLKQEDNRVKGVKKYVEKISSKTLKREFLKRYSKGFHIEDEAPCKPLERVEIPLAKQLTGTGTRTDIYSDVSQDKPARKKTTAHTIPDDFVPNETSKALADELGISWEAELPKFRDHHLHKGTLGKDWNAGFRTWLNNAVKFGTAAKAQSSSWKDNPLLAGAI